MEVPMIDLKHSLHLYIFLITCAFLIIDASNAQAKTVMVLSENSTEKITYKNDDLSRHTNNLISNHLINNGYLVFDNSTLQTNEGFVRDFSFNAKELIKTIGLMEAPQIDLVIINRVKVYDKISDFKREVSTQIESRLIDVRTSQILGNLSVQNEDQTIVPIDCSEECISFELTNYTQMLANDLGALIVTNLQQSLATSIKQNSNDYTLIFRNFNPKETSIIEEYLSTFSGYRKHTIRKSTLRSSIYIYETNSGTSRLNRNLRKMLEHIKIKGFIYFSNNKFIVRKSISL